MIVFTLPEIQLSEQFVNEKPVLNSSYLSNWKWYQEWNEVIFIHWQIPLKIIESLIPEELSIDLFEGSCFITLVAYNMNNIRHIYTPAIPYISDFHQINIRTYVKKENKPGIYIFHIEAQKLLPGILARIMSGLNYKKASMKRKKVGNLNFFRSNNVVNNFSFETSYTFGNKTIKKTELDNWLLNRYHLYQYEKNNLYRIDIKRQEWVINQIIFKKINLNYQIGNLSLNNNQAPFLAHYSKGVKALVWYRKLLPMKVKF